MTIKDMTIGNPTRLLLGFALPLFIGNTFQQFYNLVDSVIVGRNLGVLPLAAVGATGPIAFLILGFVQGLTSGFSVVTAQRFGAKDFIGVRKSFTATILLAILFTIFLTIFSTSTAMPLLKLMNTPADIIQDAFNYIFIIYVGIGTIVFYNMLSNIIRALGDSKNPLYFLILASILNIILDLIFIVKLKTGVQGAAWATVISQGFSGLLCLLFIFWKFPILRIQKSDWNLSKNFIWEHIRLGLPMGLQLSVLTIGIIAVQYVLNSFGPISIAAFTTAVKIDQMATQPFLAIGVAIATYTAQNYGAGKINRIKIGASQATKINIIMSILSAIAVLTLGKQMVGVFISGNEPLVISQAQTFLNINVIFFFCFATLVLYRNVLQGIGNAKIPLFSSALELVMRSGAAFLFGHYFGYLGVCFAGPCAWLSAAIWLSVGYKKTIKKVTLSSQEQSKPLSFLNLND